MTVYNEQPKPRVLFEDVPDDIFEQMAPLVPTARRVEEGEEVHETEYDLLVTFSAYANARSRHLHVLAFGPSRIGIFPSGAPHSESTTTLASRVQISMEVDSEAKQLIERSVIGTMPDGEKAVFTSAGHRSKFVPIVALGDEAYRYVFLWKRGSAEFPAGLTLVLPGTVTEHKDWLIWFLEYLHGVDAATFPAAPDWRKSPMWATAGTLERHRVLDKARQEKADELARLEQVERDAQEKLEAAQREDADGMLRLLTAGGDELVTAVIDALQVLGFIAQDMDGHHDAKTKAKLEDLRITDPETEDWICLAEVKGYTKGAKTSDVAQIIGRPLRNYRDEAGKYPSAVWHIVNPFREKDPSTRAVAIPNDLDLGPLADADGALIDTRDLFLAVRDVEAGAATAEDIRASLQQARTRWTYTAT